MERRNPVKNSQVGKNLRRLRLEKKLSIRAFCEKMDPPIQPGQLLATEKLKREPSLIMVQRYANALGVSVDKLLNAEAEKKQAKQ